MQPPANGLADLIRRRLDPAQPQQRVAPRFRIGIRQHLQKQRHRKFAVPHE
jgi:hypothetical protein